VLTIVQALHQSSSPQEISALTTLFSEGRYSEAESAARRLGTWMIDLTHQSKGAFGSRNWVEKYHLYIDKWE